MPALLVEPRLDHRSVHRREFLWSPVFPVAGVLFLAGSHQKKPHPPGSEPDRSLVNEMVTVTEAPYEVSIAQGFSRQRGANRLFFTLSDVENRER